jgi:formamidopyrimidine-DNA glycosylase
VPEGHTVHRLAGAFRSRFAGQQVRVSSPQGRFAAGAALLDGAVLGAADAHGKQMFLGFRPVDAGARTRPRQWLRVHLGLYGTWSFGPLGDDGPPPPWGALRVRIEGDREYADLRGPTGCEVVTTAEKDLVQSRLGPDPLRRDGSGERFAQRVLRSRAPLATLLMDQSVISGIGNVYRAEVLFRHGLWPDLPGTALDPDVATAVWDDLVLLLRDGVRRGRIVTVAPGERPRGRVRLEDAHYVYRRTGLPCRRCGTPVVTRVHLTRNLFWCPTCQAP